MKHPLISVILPVYKGEKYIGEAIDSILNQTFSDFELIIVIDGSKDDSFQIANCYSDNRIKIYNLPLNLGLVGALNKCIEFSSGDFIARMDQDDIADPNRLMQQTKFLETNPTVGIVGTWSETFGIESVIKKMPITNSSIRISLFFESPFCHPSVMIRKGILQKYNLSYNPQYKDTEDWALWSEMSKHPIEMANLPVVLLKYRIEGQSTTEQSRKIRKEQFKKVYDYNFRLLNINVTDELLELHWAFNSLDFNNVKVSQFVGYLNLIKKRLIDFGFERSEIEKIILPKSNRVFCKIADKSRMQAIKYMVKNNLLTRRNLIYLLSTFKSKQNIN